jgi:hypothetical protein
MARTTVKERALALMSDGEPRTIRRIAYELNAGYSTVAQLVQEGLLVKIGRENSKPPFRSLQPIVIHAGFGSGRAQNEAKREPR